MRQRIDLTGKTFGLVTVESFAGLDGNSKSTWNVVCECGVRRVAQGQVLRQSPPNTHTACKRARWAEREQAKRERGE